MTIIKTTLNRMAFRTTALIQNDILQNDNHQTVCSKMTFSRMAFIRTTFDKAWLRKVNNFVQLGLNEADTLKSNLIIQYQSKVFIHRNK
jgi:hypothetical protein